MLSERLAQKRLEKKLTHQNMADKLGITRQAYGNYESGKRDLDTETLSKIADILETTTDYLLGRTHNPSPKNTAAEDAEIDELLKNEVHGAFFKGYLEAPEQRKAEMRQFLKFILEQEKDRKPGQRQGE
ncbi:helix-turn-helix domain-containing protein [Paenibacillus apiarius]|uniref:helix-turn-helix domain-containing protein n=1 Tax=Paenibacillus apiarius TaxID=46240 RepID=UPI003B3B412C